MDWLILLFVIAAVAIVTALFTYREVDDYEPPADD